MLEEVSADRHLAGRRVGIVVTSSKFRLCCDHTACCSEKRTVLQSANSLDLKHRTVDGSTKACTEDKRIREGLGSDRVCQPAKPSLPILDLRIAYGSVHKQSI